MKKKGNRRMLAPKHKFIHNHIHISLFVCINILFVNKVSIALVVSSSTNNRYTPERNKDFSNGAQTGSSTTPGVCDMTTRDSNGENTHKSCGNISWRGDDT